MKTVEIVTKYRIVGVLSGEKIDIDILKKVTFQSYFAHVVLFLVLPNKSSGGFYPSFATVWYILSTYS